MEDKQIEIEYRGSIAPAFLARAISAFDEYKGAKQTLEARIRENNEWYKAQYWKMINGKNEAQPATAFIFSAIENKYADAVDNFPVPNLLERGPEDTQIAQTLSKIIPLQLDMNGFKEKYKDNWRRKLKHGTAVYGIFYNEDKADIDVRVIDLFHVYCDIHLKDIQESPFLFVTNVVDNAQLRQEYPAYAPLFSGDAQLRSYSGSHTVKDRSEVVDCYYKKKEKGQQVLHLMKLVDGHVIDATEDREGFENGLYQHGLYPVVFDVLYPEEDSPFGFGIIDVIKNPQIYVDKLDGIISKNAMVAGKIRYMVKDNGGINEHEMMDYSKDIIHVAGSVDESNVRQFQAAALDSFIITHRQNKIVELKEIVGNRDFQQGGTNGGVTAASAISMLQQAGEKLSRSMIDDSYDAYRKLVLMMIELIREFYTKERVYRITNEVGQTDFRAFSGEMLYRPDFSDSLGFDMSTGRQKVEFDISVVPQRQNPFTKEINNQTILSLWQNGLFQRENLDTAMIVLQALQFDGKDKILSELVQLKNQEPLPGESQNMGTENADQAAAPKQLEGIEDLGNGLSAVPIGELQ